MNDIPGFQVGSRNNSNEIPGFLIGWHKSSNALPAGSLNPLPWHPPTHPKTAIQAAVPQSMTPIAGPPDG